MSGIPPYDGFKPFAITNPTKIAAPDFQCFLEERKIGGLGVYLTKHFVDAMAYQRRDNKNVLVMTKKIF